MKKRILALVLALAMAFSLLVFPASAAEEPTSGTCGDNVTWVLSEDGVLTISGTGAMENYYDRDSPFYEKTAIQSVIITSGVASIGAGAFCGCSNLTSVTIPDSVTSIGMYAFDKCSGLTGVTIPDSVTSIGTCAFFGCSSLTNITIPDSVTNIEGYAFHSCSNLTSITIPDSVTSIGQATFDDCCNLKSVTIPDTVTSIGDYAFSRCSSLTSVTIPDSVTNIGNYAFKDCSSLSSVTIGNCVTNIGCDAFSCCSSLTSITIPGSVTNIDAWTFYGCSSMTSVTIPDSITSIGSRAFSDCSCLSDVYYAGDAQQWNMISIEEDNSPLTNAVIHFADGTTSNDPVPTATPEPTPVPSATPEPTPAPTSGACGDNLTWELNGDVLTIRGEGEMWNFLPFDPNDPDAPGWGDEMAPAFPDDAVVMPWLSHRDSIQTVVIESGVTTIGNWAFAECRNLTEIHIPVSVTYIGYYPFVEYDNYWGYLSDVYYDGTNEQWTQVEVAKIESIEVPVTSEPTIYTQPEAPVESPAPIDVTRGAASHWNDHTYQVFTGYAAWSDAKAYCESLGGHLATITSSEEQEALEQLNNGGLRLWLGGFRDLDDLDSWQWITGEPWDYTNWGENEPDNMDIEYRVVMEQTEWNDLCDDSPNHDGFICEWEENIPVPTPWPEVTPTPPPVETPYPTTEPKPMLPPLDYYTEVSNSRANLAWLLWRLGGSPYYERENSPFTDIDYLDDEHYSAVRWVYDNEIMRGYEDGSFQPDNKITRAEVAQVFYNMEGSPGFAGEINNPFVDVSESDWPYPAVMWYAQNPDRFGDYSATSFAPNECSSTFSYDPNTGKFTMSWDHHDPMEPPLTEKTTVGSTRAEIVWLMWRIAGAPDYTYRSSYFYDVSPSDYYYSAVIWAVDQGITNGVDQYHFSPYSSCTRAQLVTFIWRCYGCPMHANPVQSFDDIDVNSYYYEALCWFTEQNGWGEYTDTRFYPYDAPDSVSYDPNTGAWTLALASPFHYYIENGEAIITGYNESLADGMDVVIPETLGGCPVTRIRPFVFSNCNVTSITIPATVTEIEHSAFAYAYYLTDFCVAEDNPNFAALDGCLVSKDGTVLVAVPCGLTGEFTTPEGVTEIGYNAFEGTLADSVTLAEGVTVIGVNAFANCYMRELDLPSTLTEIGDCAISGCPLEYVTYHGGQLEWSRIKIGTENVSLQNAQITFLNEDPNTPAGLSYEIVDGKAYITGCDQHLAGTLTVPETLEGCPVVGIRHAAFDSCQKLTAITLPDTVRTIEDYAFIRCSDLQQIAIPEGVERIGVCAFEDCAALTTVTIPRSVTFIDIQAFDGTRVKNIYYGGTEEMWDDVIIKVGNERLYRAAVHFPPIVIIEGPADATALPSEEVSFHVDVAGTNLTYQWQYKTPSGGAWKNSSSKTAGYNTDTLTVAAASGATNRDGYQYRCVVTDAEGNTVVSDSATLNVVDFAITQQPMDASVIGSAAASFKVAAIGSGLTYQWQYLNASGVWKNCSAATAGYNAAELKVVGAKGSTNRDGYQYRCVVTDANGNTATSDAALLTVFAIKTQPKAATAIGSDLASFKVAATGADLTYQWQYKTPSGIWKNCTSATLGYNTNELLVAGVTGKTIRDGYQYRCVVKDADGNTLISDAALLTVFAIKTQPKAATVTGSEEATFKVVAIGEDLAYQWQFKKPGGSWKDCTSATAGYNTATLTVQGVTGKTNRNGYQYRCIITSGTDTITSNAAKLTVK